MHFLCPGPALTLGPPLLCCAGYKLKDASHVEVDLCPVGTVSFYSSTGDRIPLDNPQNCMACSALDGELGLVAPNLKWGHTYAPRAGMTACIPCPGGTIPQTTNGVTDTCVACPNGQYRDVTSASPSCSVCPAGQEVGPSSKMDCKMW